MSKEVLIIMPAYNEEHTIGAVLQKLTQPEIAAFADVLVLNDASTDLTAQVVSKMGCKVVNHVFNLGYGSGLQVGFKYAMKHGYSYVIQMDADGQHDPCNVIKIYEELKKPAADGEPIDIVLGSRFVDGAKPFAIPVTKRIAFVLFRWLIKLMTGKKIMDPTSGLQGLSRRCLWFYSQYAHFDDKFPDANMLIQMMLLGFEVREVPAVMHQRTEGTSMHSGIIKPSIYMLRMGVSMIAVWIRVAVLKIDKGCKENYERAQSIHKTGK